MQRLGAFLLYFQQFAKNHPKNYVDGGIAEQYTVTLGGAIAAAGTRAIIFQNATFLQRAYDQLNHDLALNKEPAIVIISNSQIGGTNDTHQGSFVYSQTSNIPNVIDLAATSEEDLFAMLNWAYNQHEHPVFIHLPEPFWPNPPSLVPSSIVTKSPWVSDNLSKAATSKRFAKNGFTTVGLYNRYHIRPELMATDIIEATKESKGPNFFKKIFSK